MDATPRMSGALWSEFERRHQPRIATRRVSDLRQQDVSGNYPPQFSDLLDTERTRGWYSRDEYVELDDQALREYNSLARLHGYSLRRTADYLIGVGYDAHEIERVYSETQARYQETKQKAEGRL